VTIKTIGVIGAGTMGAGIAQVCAQAGFKVVMRDIAEKFVNNGLNMISKNLDREVKKNRLSQEDANAITGRILGTVNLAGLAECDFIIEAVIEQMSLKKELYQELDKICPARTNFCFQYFWVKHYWNGFFYR